MTHPLANDPNTPAILRRAFAAVTHQIVRHYADGSEWAWNLNLTQTPHRDAIANGERARIGQIVDGKKLIRIEIRGL